MVSLLINQMTPKRTVLLTGATGFHKNHGKKATITSVYPVGRFGALNVENGYVRNFEEKPKGDGGLINGGFFCSFAGSS